jgi:hypothetical protein
MKMLDANENILEWSSEGIAIPYVKPTTGRVHRYYPDFWVRSRPSRHSLPEQGHTLDHSLPEQGLQQAKSTISEPMENQPQSFRETTRETIYEVKPAYQLRVPTKGRKKKKTLLAEAATYAINQAKFAAGRQYAAARGMEFKILTEKELGLS